MFAGAGDIVFYFIEKYLNTCAYTTHMVKVISVSEDAYGALKQFKREHMSFSEVILEKIAPRNGAATETLHDLLRWIKLLPQAKKKERINIDHLIYGISQ